MNYFNAGALIYQGEKIAFGDSQLLKLLEPERVKEVFEIIKNEIKNKECKKEKYLIFICFVRYHYYNYYGKRKRKKYINQFVICALIR